MRTPLWETSAGALAALLNARGPLEKADLYTLALAGGGTVLRWSGAAAELSGNGLTWALGPGLQRSRVRFTVGVEVDAITVTLTDIRGTTINGQALIPFIRAGGLANARLQLERAFWGPGDTAPVGALLWFVGRVAEISKIDRYHAELSVKSNLELLDVMIPRDLYQAGCLNTLYDSACGVVRASYTVTGTAVGATDAARITFDPSLAQTAGWFDLGVITFTSGANAGISRTVKSYAPAALTVLQPWPFPVAPGDAFSIYPGCDKSQTGANGCAKFYSAANVALRFRGHPYVPVPETVM